MKIVGIIISIILYFFGILFVISSSQVPDSGPRILVGLILFIIASIILYFSVRKNKEKEKMEIIQKIDISGDVNMEKITCKNCGAPLTPKDISVKAGAIFVSCPYCHSTYQIEEEPKW